MAPPWLSEPSRSAPPIQWRNSPGRGRWEAQCPQPVCLPEGTTPHQDRLFRVVCFFWWGRGVQLVGKGKGARSRGVGPRRPADISRCRGRRTELLVPELGSTGTAHVSAGGCRSVPRASRQAKAGTGASQPLSWSRFQAASICSLVNIRCLRQLHSCSRWVTTPTPSATSPRVVTQWTEASNSSP